MWHKEALEAWLKLDLVPWNSYCWLNIGLTIITVEGNNKALQITGKNVSNSTRLPVFASTELLHKGQ